VSMNEQVDESTTISVAPGPQQTLAPVPQVVLKPSSDEVLDMLAEENMFAADAQLQEAAAKLLAAGYTAKVVARKLKIKASTLLLWTTEERFARAFEVGREQRKLILGQDLQSAAENAVTVLSNVASDSTVAAQHRVKAAEAILDRCGLVSVDNGEVSTATVAVSIDFDERLAQIVARSKG